MASFLQHGKVECVCSDNATRQFAARVCSPWCVTQPILAILLGHGFIDLLSIKHPLSAWVPVMSIDKFHPLAVSNVPNIADKVNSVLQSRVEELLQLFSDLSEVLENPDDAVHLLPMGVYVEFQFRSTYEGLAEAIGKMMLISSPGVAEIRYAFASVLSELLVGSGDIRYMEFDVYNIPSVLCSPMLPNSTNLTSSTISDPGENLFSKD